MTYEDLLLVPYQSGGRSENGMDCYGLVLECCSRAGTPLKDILNNGHVPENELPNYIASLNCSQVDSPKAGNVVQCEYDGELHIGYMLDKKRVLHMTYSGVRVSPLLALRNVKHYEVIV